ncbi:MAG TPA: tetratricopeptide repeat protein [Bryobacteraceae bacterium]|nr:tetratricopeptide repeat protein [Bryobacteraceae bacterium]
MSFWRKEVIQPALDSETRRQMEEQLAWIAREPENARPYFHLAEFYRMEGRTEEAFGLLLHAIHLDANFAAAHAALAEVYAVRGDYPAAWRHARSARNAGDSRAVELLTRHSVPE